MNYIDIEKLKYTLANLVRQGCRIKIPDYSIDGKVVGVGFKPYWTNPYDSKIDKLEFNILDRYGNIFPFYFNFITGYDVLSYDGREFAESKNINIDIFMYYPNKARAGNEDSSEKVRIEIISEPVK